MPPMEENRIDNVKAFLEPTTPVNFNEYYNRRKQLLGAEFSVAVFHPEDFYAIQETVRVILRLYRGGRYNLALDLSVLLMNYVTSTKGEDGRFMENAMKHKIEYTQSQHLYQHLEKLAKRGLILGRKKE